MATDANLHYEPRTHPVEKSNDDGVFRARALSGDNGSARNAIPVYRQLRLRAAPPAVADGRSPQSFCARDLGPAAAALGRGCAQRRAPKPIALPPSPSSALAHAAVFSREDKCTEGGTARRSRRSSHRKGKEKPLCSGKVRRLPARGTPSPSLADGLTARDSAEAALLYWSVALSTENLHQLFGGTSAACQKRGLRGCTPFGDRAS